MIETYLSTASLMWGFVILSLLVLTFIRYKTKIPLSYSLKKDFLSPAENNFYRVLETALSDTELKIFAKVGISDLFRVTSKGREKISGFNKIRSKHVDFLICNKDLQPVVAIELDDSSHKTSTRTIESDQFKNKLYTDTNFPLLRIKGQKNYNVEEIRAKVKSTLTSKH